MMRTGIKKLGVHSANAAMIGDRMDTDIVAGMESGMDTVLVLSGVSSDRTILNFPYRPKYVWRVSDVLLTAQIFTVLPHRFDF